MKLFVDFKCEDCGFVFLNCKNSITENFSKKECPACGGEKTRRIWSAIKSDVCEGKVGNSRNGYSNNVVYHPSSIMGKMKGKKIK